MSEIMQMKMRKPDDFHVHLREGDLLKEVLPYTAKRFRLALVMPNLKKAIHHSYDAKAYLEQIQKLAEGENFTPLGTIKLTDRTEPRDIENARHSGILAAKLYPTGATTNSYDGVSDPAKLAEVFDAMAAVRMVLCVHAENPGSFTMDRETHYVNVEVANLVKKHPKLKVVIEHATTAGALNFVREHENVAATITAHHLVLTLDDVVGTTCSVHNFCKPVAKRPEDREALLTAAFSDEPRFFFGSDSAPHTKDTKECASGCAGCFTAPIAIELLATIFDQHGVLHTLEAFMSEKGAKFYGLKRGEEQMLLQRETWTVPETYGSVVPFWAGKPLSWKVAGVST